MGEDIRLNAYFERIGFAGSIAPTLATLEALHALQPAAIPFENLDSLAGVPVRLDPATLDAKLLGEKRGGYCFELNLLFLRVLRELGFEARAHLAGVLWGGRPVDELMPDHMMITLELAGTTHIADVGFGGLLMTAPLKLKTGVEQQTPLATYRLTGEDPALRLEVLRPSGEWRPAYQFSLEEVPDATFAEISDALNADPDWFFHRHLLVERAPPAGRRLLFDNRLTVHSAGEREVSHIGSGAGLRDTLAAVFGLVPPPGEGLEQTFDRLAQTAAPGD